MFVHYGGTIDQFKQLGNIADYNQKIVFIKGGENGKGAAVYTHGNYYANVGDALQAAKDYVDAEILKLDAGTVAAQVNANKQALEVLNGLDAGKSAREIVQDEVAKQLESENISESFDTLKEMAEWLSNHPQEVTEINSKIEALEGLVGETSVNAQIKAEIEKLDVEDAAVAGQYVSAVSETDGKITVSRESLPTYTLGTGMANGTVAFNGTDVAVKGLASAAYAEASAFDVAGSANAAKDYAKDYADGLAGNYATAEQGAKADAAAPQATTYTKDEVDAMWEWEELN